MDPLLRVTSINPDYLPYNPRIITGEASGCQPVYEDYFFRRVSASLNIPTVEVIRISVGYRIRLRLP